MIRLIPSGSNIVVWFSCGAASAVAAKKTIELYGDTCNVRVVNNGKIKEEEDDNYRFLKDVEKWLGIEIEFAINDDYPNMSCMEIWEERQFMSNRYGAPCTKVLKKEARYQFEAKNHICYHVLGFTSEEEDRHKKFILTERENVIPVLINENISKGDCFNIIVEAGIDGCRFDKLTKWKFGK